MTTRTFFIIGAALGVIYGIGFLLIPETLADIYGSAISPSMTLGYRYFGTALLGVGLIVWALKDLRDPVLLQGVLFGHGVADLAGVFVSIWGTMHGTINGLGWMNVALYAALTAGCIYLYRGVSSSAAAMPV